MIRKFEIFSAEKSKKVNESSETSKMTKELSKEMFEYLDAKGEHKLVSKYKGVVTDNDISSVIQAWATSIKPLGDIIEDYLELHKISESVCNMVAPWYDALNKSVDEATKILNDIGYSMRVMKLDGEQLVGTMDYNPKRLDVVVENGIVTAFCKDMIS